MVAATKEAAEVATDARAAAEAMYIPVTPLMFQPTLPYLVSAKEKGVSEDVCVTRGGFKNVGIQVKQRLQPLVSLPMYLNGVDVEARARRGGDEERW